ncbi:33844_t:CDS:2, partial [Racocetra persica]
MEHITVEYYCAGTPYLSPEAIEEIIQSRGTVKMYAGKWLIDIVLQLVEYMKFGKDMLKAYPCPKKRNPGSSSRSVRVSDSVNILIKKVVEMDNLQARLAQNRKEREEAKHETKR